MSNQLPGYSEDMGRKRQSEIYVSGMSGIAPPVPVSIAKLEAAAREAMSREGYAYMAGGAGTESTIQSNRDAFKRWRIVPRMLRDVSVRDTSIELFGQRLPSPFLLAPIGVLEMAHPEADLAVARAAASETVPMIFSNQASYPMESCAAAMGDSPRWFQLYWSRMDDLVESFVQRAEACGCSAIVLTLDTTMLGWRIRDLDLAYLPFLRGKGIAQYTSDPVFLRSLENAVESEASASRRLTPRLILAALQMASAFPGGLRAGLRNSVARKAVQQFIGTYSRPSLTWDDLNFLREKTKLPILLKGILHPDDARRAIDQGMNGLIVSNHGGRQVDGAIASLDALPPIIEAVAGQVPVLLDSGIRSGADAFKALALGAKAVCIGRPYAYGLAAGGEEGVRNVLQNFKADFDLTMGLAGCTSVDEITSETVMQV